MLDEPGYRALKPAVRRTTGLDLDRYRPGRTLRRVSGYICRTSTAGWRGLAASLDGDADAAARLRRYLSVGASEFFGGAGSWAALERRVLPALLSERSSLRVWSAGCSHGAEAFSVAMLLAEAAPGRVHRVLGTDSEPARVRQALAGDGYLPHEVRNVSPQRLGRWFRAAGGGYAVRDELRRRARFRVHEALEAPIDERFDLVICRNVAIFLSDGWRVRLAGRLARALRIGGWLFVGDREAWPAARLFGLEPSGGAFYRRSAAAG